jgi:hypothetical protein
MADQPKLTPGSPDQPHGSAECRGRAAVRIGNRQ